MATPATRAHRGHATRVACLLSGLACCATGIVLTLRAGLGVSPWDVLHAGIAERLGADFGTVVIGLGAVVLAASLLLGVRPGGGTVANMLLIGLMENALLDLGVLDRLADGALLPRVVVLVVGVATIGLGSALYIGAHYGAGPRDGLMVALHQRAGVSVGVARTVTEASALLAGLALGGPVGAGTVVFTLGIGPLTQLAFTLLRMSPDRRTETTNEPY